MNTTASQTKTRIPSRRLFSIPGLRFEVYLFGEQKPVSSNGYIGKLFCGGKAVLRAVVLPGYSFIGFKRQENDAAVTMMRNHGGDGELIYETHILILKVRGGRVWYPNPSDAVWLLAADPQGRVHNFTVSLVNQHDHCFLVMFSTFTHQCYQGDDGSVHCPELAREWQSMAVAVSSLVAVANVELPPLSAYSPQSVMKEQFGEGMGRVKWWSLRLQIGVVATDKGDARAHWTQVKTERSDGLRYLAPNEIVSFSRIERRQNGHKQHPEWEIADVTVLS